MKKFVILLTCLLLLGMIPVSAAANTGTLAGKTALFAGDSIAAGWRDELDGKAKYTSGGGWALRLEKDYYMRGDKVAAPGQSLTVIPNRGHIIQQLHENKGGTYDYVILQGGFNDCMGENRTGNTNMDAIPKLGTVTDSFDVEDFDTATFAGSFEELLYYATTYFPQARIGFIVTYKTPLSAYGGITNGVVKTKEGYRQEDYIQIQKDICDKWDVPYLDLWSGKTADGRLYSGDVLQVNTDGVHFPGGGDNIHLNTAGYDAITPHVAIWMAGLSRYTDSTPTTTTTTAKPTTTTTTAAPTTTTTTTAKPTTTTTTAAPTTTTTATEAVTTTTTVAATPQDAVSTPLEEDRSPLLPIILTVVACAAALAVIAALVIVLLRRRGA